MLSIIGSPNPVVAPAPPPMVQQGRPVQTPPAQSPRQPAALLSPVHSPAQSPAPSPAPSPGRSPVGSAETAEEKQKKAVIMQISRRRRPENTTLFYEDVFSRNSSWNMTMLDPDDLTPGEIVFSTDDGRQNHDKSLLAEIFGKKHGFSFGGNLTGLIVLCIVLTAVIVIFFGCYLMMRFMHRALSRDDSKDILRSSNPYNNVVMHAKRVYEIQAEEGCFSGAPDPLEQELDEEPPNDPVENQTSFYVEDGEESKVKKPETGDLKAIRTESYEDDPRAMLRKKQKVHKDSVCAFLFKPQTEPKMV